MLHSPCDLMEVQVNGDRTFFVAKDLLLCRCGRLLREYKKALKAAKMENDEAEEEDDDDELSVRMLLHDLPGGAKAFEMVVDFCYGDAKLKLGVENVVYLRCAAQYLEMSEKYGTGNLIQKTESFLSDMASWGWKDVIAVLQSCDAISRSAEEAGIIQQCVDTLAAKALDMSTKLMSSSVVSPSNTMSPGISCSPRPLYHYNYKPAASPSCRSSNSDSPLRRRIIHHKSSSDMLPYAAGCGNSPQTSAQMSWWCEDPSPLSIHLMDRLVLAMKEHRVQHRHLARFLLRYLEGSLQTVSGYTSLPHTFDSGEKILFENAQKLQRQTMEMVVRLLYSLEWDSLPVKCLFELRRVSMAANVSSLCKNQLEKMIGSQLHKASLDNILVPQFSNSREHRNCSYDVDFILRLVRLFLLSGVAEKLQAKPGYCRKVDMDGTSTERDSNEYYECDSGVSTPLRTVAALMDMFLAEIAPDMYLEASRFAELAQALPCAARDTHDSLYRALDIYIQAHPRATREDIDQLFAVIDFGKLSAEACKHAMLNPRIPVRFTFHILAAQQDELRNVVEAGVQTSRRTSAESNDTAYPSSYASLIKQNEELRSDLQSMHCKVAKLEKLCTALRSQLSPDLWLG